MVPGSHLNGWMWLFMGSGQLAFWVLVIAGFVLLRHLRDNVPLPAVAAPGPADRPEHLLAARFARGDIDETEYERRLAVLRRHAHVVGTSAR